MSITSLVVLAICTEAIITGVKEALTGGIKWQMLMAWAIGITIAIAYSADLLATEGLISTIPFVGNVITGIAIGRGSNFFFDLIKSIGNR